MRNAAHGRREISRSPAVRAVHRAAIPLTGAAADYDPLLSRIGDARFVLIGEASHGTHEFYRERARITRRLIEERGFAAIAVEADWPDAYRVNRYVQGLNGDADARSALAGFQRFPTWMWRNTDVLRFLEWLRGLNDLLPAGSAKCGFYGLDLYSLYTSLEAVVAYLDRIDPEAARRARERYACFEHFGADAQVYGAATARGSAESCEAEVVDQLLELRRRAAEYAERDGRIAEDEYFYAEQNARLVKNAEEYYRSMFRGRTSSWNLRDRHMAETLEALVDHLGREGRVSKIVVWAHNSHLGDARATEMGDAGELNLGQLVRERWGEAAVLIGLSTYEGTVTAASNWDEPAQRKSVRPGLPGSYEDLFHAVARESADGGRAAGGGGSEDGALSGTTDFMVLLTGTRGGPAPSADAVETLREPRLQRAIGVIYRPETERQSHYLHARLRDQFDAILHFDRTSAVEPLERLALWETGDAPETYPSAL